MRFNIAAPTAVPVGPTVPESSTLALLGAAVAVLAAVKKRKQ